MATHISTPKGQLHAGRGPNTRPHADQRSSAQPGGSALLDEVRSLTRALVGREAAYIDVVDVARLGDRVKVAVASTRSDVDPVAYCAGAGGRRAREFSSQLGALVEFVPFDPDPERYIAAALNIPVRAVRIDNTTSPPTAVAVVDTDIYPLAVGKRGANARCASSLTWHFVTICTPNCSSTMHHHPVGISPSNARPRLQRGTPSHKRAATPAPTHAVVLPPLPPHVRSARVTRQRRIQEAKRRERN